jgi:hypothetical protein
MTLQSIVPMKISEFAKDTHVKCPLLLFDVSSEVFTTAKVNKLFLG